MLSFILLCALLLVTHFKDSILQTFLCIGDSIHRIYFYVTYIFNTLYGLYTIWKELKQLQPQNQCFQQPKTSNLLVQISPPPDKFLTEVRKQLIILIQTLPLLDEYLTEAREQLIIPSSTEQIPSIQGLHQDSSDSEVFETEHLLLLHTPNIFKEWTYSPPVIFNDRAFTKFLQGEKRCLKFINQDLTFLQSSSIPSTFSNISHAASASAKVKQPTRIQLSTHISQENNNTPPTQTVEPVLGFTPTEICQAQSEPKLTVQQLLEIESCKDCVKTPLQTLDSIYVNQPKRFLPLTKEAKKLAEEFRKEEIVSQWAGIPPEKLLQESFEEQLNSLQSLDQLAPLMAAKEYLPKDIINILELLGKADNIPFNQLYNLAENCADRYYTKVIKTLTHL